MQNVVGPTLVAMEMTFWLGAEIQSPTGLIVNLSVQMFLNTIIAELLETPSWNFQCIITVKILIQAGSPIEAGGLGHLF